MKVPAKAPVTKPAPGKEPAKAAPAQVIGPQSPPPVKAPPAKTAKTTPARPTIPSPPTPSPERPPAPLGGLLSPGDFASDVPPDDAPPVGAVSLPRPPAPSGPAPEAERGAVSLPHPPAPSDIPYHGDDRPGGDAAHGAADAAPDDSDGATSDDANRGSGF